MQEYTQRMGNGGYRKLRTHINSWPRKEHQVKLNGASIQHDHACKNEEEHAFQSQTITTPNPIACLTCDAYQQKTDGPSSQTEISSLDALPRLGLRGNNNYCVTHGLINVRAILALKVS